MGKINKGKYGPGTLLILLVLASLFAFVKIRGSVIHDEIVSELNLVTKFEKEENYQKVEEHLTRAENKFGIIYSLHVNTLNEGDNYFVKDTITGQKGYVQIIRIAFDMSEGNVMVQERLEQAAKNLEYISKEKSDSKFHKLYTLGSKSLKALKALLPVVELCKSSEFTKAKEELEKFSANKDYLEPNSLFVSLSMYYKIAEATKSPQDVSDVARMTGIFAEASNGKIHRQLAEKAINLQKELFNNQVPASMVQDSVVQEKNSEKLSVEEKYKLALTLAKEGKFEEAKKLLEQCNEERPQNNQICYLLAVVCDKLDLQRETRLFCKEILERDPNHEKAKKLLEKVSF